MFTVQNATLIGGLWVIGCGIALLELLYLAS